MSAGWRGMKARMVPFAPMPLPRTMYRKSRRVAADIDGQTIGVGGITGIAFVGEAGYKASPQPAQQADHQDNLD